MFVGKYLCLWYEIESKFGYTLFLRREVLNVKTDTDW